MPLDRVKGEILQGLGSIYRIAALEKYAGTSFFSRACEHACRIFKEAGAMSPIKIMPEDVLIQEYPMLNKIVFIIQRVIAGQESYALAWYDLDQEFVQAMRNAGQWHDVKVDLGLLRDHGKGYGEQPAESVH